MISSKFLEKKLDKKLNKDINLKFIVMKIHKFLY